MHTRTRLIGFFLIFATALLDQVSKTAVLTHAASLPMSVLPFFSLVLVHNTGISFGVMAHASWMTPQILTAAIALITLVIFVWFLRSFDAPTVYPLGLVLGGAIGNIIDRVRFGSVTDFLDFHLGRFEWPAFNIADSAICIGVVILVLISIVGPSSQQETTT